MKSYKAFTLKASGILNKLQTDTIILSEYRDKKKNFTPQKWKSLWDTGATSSAITKRIVDELALVPCGKVKMNTANGYIDVNTYLVNIVLPNGVTAKNVLVSCCNLGADVDILIGMDIIKHGDFSITNVGNKTTFSFRTPSVKEIDYVKELNDTKD